MSNYYTIHVADEILPCDPADVILAQQLLCPPHEDKEPERAAIWEGEEYEFHGFEVEEMGNGLFLYAELNGTTSYLPPDFLNFIGSLIAKAGLPYLGMGFAVTCDKLRLGSHSGSDYRIYPDGSIVFPSLHYQPTDIKWPEVA